MYFFDTQHVKYVFFADWTNHVTCLVVFRRVVTGKRKLKFQSSRPYYAFHFQYSPSKYIYNAENNWLKTVNLMKMLCDIVGLLIQFNGAHFSKAQDPPALV